MMEEKSNAITKRLIEADDNTMNSLQRERQKKHLRKFVKMPLIPTQVGIPPDMKPEHLDKLLQFYGFTVYESDSEYFFRVTYPKGWSKILVPGLTQWCYLIDGKGRKRAAIYYQDMGSFEDEELPPEQRGQKFRKVSSHINWMPRYRVKVDHVVPYNVWKGANQTNEHYNSPVIGYVMEAEKNVLFKTGMFRLEHDRSKERDKWFDEERKARDTVYNICVAWLNEMFPEHENVARYWEETEEAIEQRKANKLKREEQLKKLRGE